MCSKKIFNIKILNTYIILCTYIHVYTKYSKWSIIWIYIVNIYYFKPVI